jgi:hypothetical protein
MGLLKKVNDALLAVNNVQHRFDPFFRPLADALLREPVARATQVFINARRTREPMQIAEERELPGERECVTGIIEDSARTCAQRTNRASFSAGETQRRTASCAASSSCGATSRRNCATVSSRHRRLSAHGCASAVPALEVLRTSTTSAC